MDDQLPEGLDEFLASDDPQSAAQVPGLKAIGKAAYESQPVQNIVTGKGLSDYQENLNHAIEGDPQAQMQLARASAGTAAMGSLGGEGAIQGLQKSLGESLEPAMFNDKLAAAQSLLDKAREGYQAGHVTADQLAFANQKFQTAQRLNMRNKYADGGEVAPPAGLDEFISSGQSAPDSQSDNANEPHGLNEFLESEQQQKYGSTGQQLKTAAEAAGEAASFGTSTGLETALGVKPEDIRARKERNPTARAVGTIAGLLMPGSPEAEALGAAGKGAASVTAKILGMGEKEAASTLQRAAVSSARGAAETALLQTGDEVSKTLSNDPEQSVQSSVANIGLSGLLGGALGAGMGAFHPSTKSLPQSNKLGQLIEDFKSRLNEHIETPDKVGAITDELSNFHNSIKDMADEVYGPQGLKAQDIAKTVPTLNDKMIGQASDLGQSVQNNIDKMLKKPNSYPDRLVSKLQGDLQAFQDGISNSENSMEVFNHIQDLKQTLQGYAKFDKFVKPVDEAYDFVKAAKNLSFDFRNALEDSNIWEDAANRQKAINKAFVNFNPTLQDFEKKFTSVLNGDNVVDPSKVSSYLGQLEKPNSELKKQVLTNFIDQANKYKNVIADTHANLGLENPMQATALNHTLGTLKDLTPGAKLADIFIKRGILDAGGKTIGAGAGAAVAHAIGASKELGALIGSHTLGPLFGSVLPVLGKLIKNAPTDVEGLHAATNYGAAVVKGQKLLDKSALGLFESGKNAVPESAIPTDKQKLDLKETLDELRTNPEKLTALGSKLSTYMPQHNVATTELATRAVQYLDSMRPEATQGLALDSKIEPSKSQLYAYDKNLELAEQPLMIFDRIKQGTITPDDVKLVGTLYPQLYGSMVQKVTNQIAEAQARGETIPYERKMAMSMFMGTPLDSTMTPQGIMAAQPLPSQPPSPAPQAGVRGGAKKSATSLNKLGPSYQTSDQANMVRKQRQK